MTRKRCCKLLMARGFSRNEANRILRTAPCPTNEDKLTAAVLRKTSLTFLRAARAVDVLLNSFNAVVQSVRDFFDGLGINPDDI